MNDLFSLQSLIFSQNCVNYYKENFTNITNYFFEQIAIQDMT